MSWESTLPGRSVRPWRSRPRQATNSPKPAAWWWPPADAGARPGWTNGISQHSGPRPIKPWRPRAARYSLRQCRHSILQAAAGDGGRGLARPIDVNLTGTCNAIRAVAPHLVRHGGGRIIVTSSTQGRHGTKYGAAYSASKWGIIGLMKSAALELGVHKITVNAVIPGLIDTPLTRHRQRYAQAVDDLNSQEPIAKLEADAEKKLEAKTDRGFRG